jgi:hypothetical protein
MSARKARSPAAVVLLVMIALVLVGCAGIFPPFDAPIIPPTGLITTNIHAPLILPKGSVDVTEIQDHADVSTVWIAIPFVTTFAWGDASLLQGLEMSRLREVHYADYQYTNFLYLLRMLEVRYYGTH